MLFLAHTLPYPLHNGAAIRVHHLLRALGRRFEVHCLCFHRPSGADASREAAEAAAAVGDFAVLEAFPIPQATSRRRFIWDHLRSLVTGRAYTRYAYASAAFADRLRELMASERFDLVHVDSLDLCDYLPALAGRTVVCDHHNIESELLRRRASGERTRWKRWYLAHQARLVAREERRWSGRVCLNVVVSAEERRAMESLAPGTPCMVVPNGVDIEEYRPSPGAAGESVVFLGGIDWYPNRDALEHFGEAILPRLRQARPDVVVRWIGRATPAERRFYRERYGIELTGYVDDVRPFLHDAACAVVPLRIGGGTRLKILTAWAAGAAVVSTAIGCEGLEAKDGENILIRDSPEAFADAVMALLSAPALRARLASAARRTVEETYSWDVAIEPMLREYAELIEASRSAVAPPRTASRPHATDLAEESLEHAVHPAGPD